MPRIRWAVKCHAHKRGNVPCAAWAVRGATVCPAHGGSLARTRQAARARLAEAVMARGFAQMRVKFERQRLDFEVGRILVTAELLGIPIERVTSADVLACHLEHGTPPLSDAGPRFADMKLDGRLQRWFHGEGSR